MTSIKVLMVEDNQGDVVLMRTAIETAQLPYDLTVLPNGEEAVQYLYAQGKYADAPRPDLILLDMKLPRKNGCEVLDEIRLDPALWAIPLILLSSSRSELDRARSYGRPPESYMDKATTFRGFIELVQAVETFRRKVAGSRG